MNDGVLIKSSWFNIHGYCEYRFFLQHVLGWEAPRTVQMIRGSQIHQQKEDSFKKVAEEATWEEFLVSEEYAITKEVMFTHRISDIFLVGKVDEIGVDKRGIYVIDDKPGGKPYLSTKMQIWSYCYLFKKKFGDKTSKKIHAVLRERDTDMITWKQEYTLNDERALIRGLQRMKLILDEKTEPLPTKNPNKCRACCFKDKCESSLVKQRG